MKAKKPLTVISTALITLIALVALVPVIAGWCGVQYRIVTTPSMTPAYAVGDLLIVAPPTGDDLRVGSPVTFRISDDPDDLPVTHRIVAVENGAATTRGDANDANDPDTITQADVIGVPVFALTGTASDTFIALNGLPGRLALIAFAVLLYAAPRLLPDPKTKNVQATDGPPPTQPEEALA